MKVPYRDRHGNYHRPSSASRGISASGSRWRRRYASRSRAPGLCRTWCLIMLRGANCGPTVVESLEWINGPLAALPVSHPRARSTGRHSRVDPSGGYATASSTGSTPSLRASRGSKSIASSPSGERCAGCGTLVVRSGMMPTSASCASLARGKISRRRNRRRKCVYGSPPSSTLRMTPSSVNP